MVEDQRQIRGGSVGISARAETNGQAAVAHEGVSLQAARQYCRRLAQAHYENFTVVSWLLPRELHQHFYNIYAYCRWADDLGDEVTNAEGRYDATSRSRSLELLAWWRGQLLGCYELQDNGRTGRAVPDSIAAARNAHILQRLDAASPGAHPVMIALSDTIARFSIPPEPFLNLIAAFEQDQRVPEYDTYEQLLGYCRNSANPVGHLVLYLCGAYDEDTAVLADSVCTGLQLTNFWQDVARDLDRGRVYLPRCDREQFGYSEANLHGRIYNDAFRALMRMQVDRARGWLERGMPLARRVPPSVQVDIELFARGGLTILDKMEALDYNVWHRRPVLNKWDQIRLIGRCTLGHAWHSRSSQGGAVLSPGRAPLASQSCYKHGGTAQTVPATRSLSDSYAYCASLARRSAKNFYFSFLALPPAKRRAMCALYAFLRTTDDIGDGPGTTAERREQLDTWRTSLARALRGRYDHPALRALHDTVTRYAIDPAFLRAAIDGVAMDLGTVRFQTFDQLCRYCFRVASVVGLSCICIWGYRGEEASAYAHQCGVAFQLTNILRDLKEDAQRGRIYLPLEDLERFGYSEDDLRASRRNEQFRELMQFQVQRVRRYYSGGAALIGHLKPVGRPVFRTMFGIYSGILEEIQRRRYDVFAHRVGLSPWRKLWILARSFVPLALPNAPAHPAPGACVNTPDVGNADALCP
jgi:phytoene synthase